ncbi:DUF2145 domain-containing protein [Roseateles violae]|uniref:DUF2145 domain-containing protein n=1 Tax=Roseateles violae TaxID=3058042 RepID=A0ABT8DMU9_9BURK|nr:DUF2145 domain-containing protein [Pelomonas sp. PFR6]MDN3919447.1 DUF2145 domain-containing protein [Pelomonas sp. PFR6]
MRRLLPALPLLLGAGLAAAQAASLRFCDKPAALTAAEQDRMLRFGAVVKQELERSGADSALIARSGLDLERLGQRYSHAGLSLRASGNTPWSVRQLYYACDEGRPRLFDQGMAGFVMGTSEPALGYVSLVLLPAEAAAALERTALDDRRALALLGGDYSANAHAWGLRYQNCNQWLVELLASAWGAAADRAAAQQWLREQRYRPSEIELGPVLMLASLFVPWVHMADHPQDDIAAGRYRLSLPVAIEGFVRERLPGARRIELCHTDSRIVVRHGWQPLADGCVAGDGDEVIALQQ